MPKTTRQLAAIMFTDIEGYTTLMQHDEFQAVFLRDEHRRIFNTAMKKWGGNVLQYYGDGTLSTFDSVVDAVQCGIEMQRAYQQAYNPHPGTEGIPVRVGIHSGDIIYTEEDVIGDGVNVASRIESLATVGSVLISDKVYDEIKNQHDIKTKSMGWFKLKNVTREVEVFAVANEGLVVPDPSQVKGKAERVPNQDDLSPGSDLKREATRSEEAQLKVKRSNLFIALLVLAVAAIALVYFSGGNGLKIGSEEQSVKPDTCMTQSSEYLITVAPFQASPGEALSRDLISSLRSQNTASNVSIEGVALYLDIALQEASKQALDSIKGSFCSYKGLVVYGFYSRSEEVLNCYVDMGGIYEPVEYLTSDKSIIIRPPANIKFEIPAQTNYLAKVILGMIYPSLGRYDESVAVLEEYLNEMNDSVPNPRLEYLLNLFLSMSYLGLEQVEDAETRLRAAQRLFPQDTSIDIEVLQSVAKEDEEKPGREMLQEEGPDKADTANRISLPSAGSSGPKGFITINGGANSTTSTTVKIQVFATNTSVIIINGDKELPYKQQQGLNYMVVEWVLTEGLGDKKVEVQFRDEDGNISNFPAAATIRLEAGN